MEDTEKLKTVNFRVIDVSQELHLFKYVIEGILSAYTCPNASIQEQFEKMALWDHILFILQRELKTFISNPLYHMTFNILSWMHFSVKLSTKIIILANPCS